MYLYYLPIDEKQSDIYKTVIFHKITHIFLDIFFFRKRGVFSFLYKRKFSRFSRHLQFSESSPRCPNNSLVAGHLVGLSNAVDRSQSHANCLSLEQDLPSRITCKGEERNHRIRSVQLMVMPSQHASHVQKDINIKAKVRQPSFSRIENEWDLSGIDRFLCVFIINLALLGYQHRRRQIV